MSQLEDEFEFQLRAYKIKYEREVRFAPPRRYRFDFLIGKLAVECQGGIFVRGGHSRGVGQERDFEKNYLALLAGYKLLYVSGDQVKDGTAIGWVIHLLESKT